MTTEKYSETWWPSGFDLAIIRETLKSQDDKIQDQEEQLGILSPVIQQMRLMQKPQPLDPPSQERCRPGSE